MIGLKLTNLNRPAFPIAEKSIEFVEYPKWIHMDGYPSELTTDAEAEAKLRSRPLPNDTAKIETSLAPIPEDKRAALISLAKEKNIKIDARWKTDRIRETIEANP